MAHDETMVPPDLELRSPHGVPIQAGELFSHELTVVQLVRYFGCLPCQEWLLDLDRARPGLLGRGVEAAAVGGSADYQARYLRDERGATLPLYLDPEAAFRDCVGADENLGLKLIDPRGAVAYVRSLKHGFAPQRVTRDTVRSPAVVILDQGGRLVWRHLGRRIGDYPALSQVSAAVDDLLAASDSGG